MPKPDPITGSGTPCPGIVVDEGSMATMGYREHCRDCGCTPPAPVVAPLSEEQRQLLSEIRQFNSYLTHGNEAALLDIVDTLERQNAALRAKLAEVLKDYSATKQCNADNFRDAQALRALVGKVAQSEVLHWILGGKSAAEVRIDRQTWNEVQQYADRK